MKQPKEKCSKWCGRGCTLSEYQRERRKALRIKKALGRGWKIRVHENLGWHHDVISPCGHIRVSDGGVSSEINNHRYWARISDEKDQPYVCWDAYGPSPIIAVRLAKLKLRKEIGTITRLAKMLARIAGKDGAR